VACWLPLVLVALWAFSPFGSQAMLRFVNVERLAVNGSTTVQYLYPAGFQSDTNNNPLALSASNVILSASLLSVGTTYYEPQDVFGNLKIPALESLNTSTESSDWISLSSFDQPSYSSLVGIPVAAPTNQGNLTFTMKSWCWTFGDPIISEYNNTNRSQVVPSYRGPI
jgi:hypothetical protein